MRTDYPAFGLRVHRRGRRGRRVMFVGEDSARFSSTLVSVGQVMFREGGLILRKGQVMFREGGLILRVGQVMFREGRWPLLLSYSRSHLAPSSRPQAQFVWCLTNCLFYCSPDLIGQTSAVGVPNPSVVLYFKNSYYYSV
jgi:hypothetical protein